MTIEEAIAHAKEQTEIFGGVHKEFLEMAIEALEKQMPKKPIKVDSGVYDYPFDYECPYCRENVDELDHRCNCGQAIDWSEEE